MTLTMLSLRRDFVFFPLSSMHVYVHPSCFICVVCRPRELLFTIAVRTVFLSLVGELRLDFVSWTARAFFVGSGSCLVGNRFLFDENVLETNERCRRGEKR